MTINTAPPAAPADPPAEPSRSDTAANFITKANNFIAWFRPLRTFLAAFVTWWTTFKAELDATIGTINAMQGVAMRYTIDTTTTADADPGAGKLRLGNATQNLSTVVRMDLLDADGNNVTAVLDTWDDSTSVHKGYLRLVNALDVTKWLLFNVAAVLAPGGWRNVTVTVAASSGANPFANGDTVIASFTRTGDLATGAVSITDVQNQQYTYTTTGGSGTAYVITPASPITAYLAGQSFHVAFHTASGANPTLQISGIATPPLLVRQLADGTYAQIQAGEIPAGHRSRVTLITSFNALVEDMPFAPGSKVGMQIFTSSGTYTPTPGTKWIEVEVQGAGGGSGGCAATAAGQIAAGLPGAGGGYGRKRITSGFSGAAVTVGGGGPGGTAGANNGTTGGTSSFGAFISSTGGGGGTGTAASTAPTPVTAGNAPSGGTSTGSDYHRIGGSPEIPFAFSTASGIRPRGGDSMFGTGGVGGAVISNNAAGAAGVGYGGGASGPMNMNGAFAAQAGAIGGPGLVVVHEYA